MEANKIIEDMQRNSIIAGFVTRFIPGHNLIRLEDKFYVGEEKIETLTIFNWRPLLVRYNSISDNYIIISGANVYDATLNYKDEFGRVVWDDNCVFQCNVIEDTEFTKMLENNQTKSNEAIEITETNTEKNNCTCEDNKALEIIDSNTRFCYTNAYKDKGLTDEITLSLVLSKNKSTMEVHYSGKETRIMPWDGKSKVLDTLDDGGKVTRVFERNDARKYAELPININKLREYMFIAEGIDISRDLKYESRHKDRNK